MTRLLPKYEKGAEMKGKATIILSDAKTGKVIQQVEEHNLFTNAMRNIFNPPHSALVHSFNYSTLFAAGLPMWKYLLGGVVLLGNTEAEIADNIMLGKDIVPVATAGTEYAGACTMRGTLNTNESYPTENGYHFTWDFGTDKANGTIKCVCLTHRMFGNSGFGANDQVNSAFMLMAPNALGSTYCDPTTMLVENGYGQYVGTFEDGLHVYMYINSNGDIELRRYKGFDTSAVKINDTVGLSAISLPLSITTVPTQVKHLSEGYFFVNTDTKTLYLFSADYSADASIGTTTITYVAVDIAKGTSAAHTVTLDRYINYTCTGAVFGGHLYMASSDGLYEFTENGTFVRKHDVSTTLLMQLAMIDGVLLARMHTGYTKCIGWTDNEFVTGQGDYITAGSFPRPYVPIASRYINDMNGNSPGNTLKLVVGTWYKATINNLSSPIEKTSEHALKIVYDITN